MKVKILVIALIVSLAMNVGTILTFSYHQWHRSRIERDRHSWPGRGPEFLKHRLDLSDEQIAEMEAMREKMFSETLPLREELSAKRKELTNLLREPEPNTMSLNALINEISQLQVQLELLIFKDIQQTKKILTPEQQEQFLEFFEQGFHRKDMHSPPPRGQF